MLDYQSNKDLDSIREAEELPRAALFLTRKGLIMIKPGIYSLTNQCLLNNWATHTTFFTFLNQHQNYFLCKGMCVFNATPDMNHFMFADVLV